MSVNKIIGGLTIEANARGRVVETVKNLLGICQRITSVGVSIITKSGLTDRAKLIYCEQITIINVRKSKTSIGTI